MVLDQIAEYTYFYVNIKDLFEAHYKLSQRRKDISFLL